MTMHVTLHEFDSDVKVKGKVTISSGLTIESRYIKILEIQNKYYVSWISKNGLFVYFQILQKNLDFDGPMRTIESSGLLDMNSISNEMALLRYDSNKIKLQRYYPT